MKEQERLRAVKANITDKVLKEPLSRNSFRTINPLRMVERVNVKKYKKLNWIEKTNANKLLQSESNLEKR